MATEPAPSPPPGQPPLEIRIYSHSSLFYWWPVWLVGLILALLTWAQGNFMIVVPKGTKLADKPEIRKDGKDDVVINRIELPAGKAHLEEDEPHLFITTHKGYGVLFAIVLLIVIFITNVPLRGMWSVLIIITIIMLSIIFQLAGIWDRIIGAFRVLDIRINLGGYIFISLGLLGLWTFAFFFFDRQLYITFAPGQLKVCMEIGAGEKSYDTMGMTIEKERSDLFRHWILGLGSGDLIVRTAGADRHEFRLHNVLFITRKLALIEELQRTRQQRPV